MCNPSGTCSHGSPSRCSNWERQEKPIFSPNNTRSHIYHPPRNRLECAWRSYIIGKWTTDKISTSEQRSRILGRFRSWEPRYLAEGRSRKERLCAAAASARHICSAVQAAAQAAVHPAFTMSAQPTLATTLLITTFNFTNFTEYANLL